MAQFLTAEALIAFALANSCGFVTNTFCFFYIKKVFDLKKCIFQIMAIDTLFATLAGFGGLLVNILFNMVQGKILCSLVMMTSPLRIAMTPVFSFLIALYR